VTRGPRLYWLIVQLVAVAGGIYGAVRFFDWATG
jgi:hypothetical protein